MTKPDFRLFPVGSHTLTRREATSGVLAAIGGAFFCACSSSSTSSSNPSGSTDAGANASPSGDAASVATENTADSGASLWAKGGTKSMSGSYPEPFPTASAACVVVATMTEGPCTEAVDQVRKDVSEGAPGIPVRLALKVVDASCQAITGAKVKIWHTQITGSYSGDTPNNGMCLKTAQDGQQHSFRGVQTSDANGRVDFDTCFPGWYPGRAIHIHFTVSLAGKSHTSQLVFDQALVDEIFSTHEEYKGYGLPDTTNAKDNVVGNVDLPTFTLTVARMADGAMLAAKELVVSVA
ncbi:MAG: protocatechuate 3,4-dioxygenase [Myxococcales bacterium]|nr:protocatechuate 3,4-dioxygenase [Myxococcales bacterium]